MNDKELGPCPLCGGKAEHRQENDHHGDFFTLGCVNQSCRLHWLWYTAPMEQEEQALKDWGSLSALAEQNRRRGEAIEKRKLEWNALLKLIEWHGGGQIIDDIDDDNQNWKKCMEWAEDERRTKNNAR